MTKRLLTEGILIDWKPTLVLPPVLGHPKRLRGLFKQLFDNALEAMSAARQQQRELRISTVVVEHMIQVSVEDSGPGIAESLRFKVFEPFFTTKKWGRHSGMGLATVQDIVNLHAGAIHIDPHYTGGCRFIVEFPSARHRET